MRKPPRIKPAGCDHWDRSSFPTATWGDATVEFIPERLPAWTGEAYAVVVMARAREGYVLADVDRGWTVPSGHVEPRETPEEAALRETREEIGAEVLGLRYVGHYLLDGATPRARVVPAYTGWVESFGRIPPGSESRGARAVPLEGLSAVYWRWDALLQRMFEYAEAQFEPASAEGSAETVDPDVR